MCFDMISIIDVKWDIFYLEFEDNIVLENILIFWIVC